jgi:hypothetical protein
MARHLAECEISDLRFEIGELRFEISNEDRPRYWAEIRESFMGD